MEEEKKKEEKKIITPEDPAKLFVKIILADVATKRFEIESNLTNMDELMTFLINALSASNNLRLQGENQKDPRIVLANKMPLKVV